MKVVKTLIFFITGILAGVVTGIGIEQLTARDGWHIGGEALIIPLMILLVYAGWSIRKESNREREREIYLNGIQEGVRRTLSAPRHPNCRHIYTDAIHEKSTY